MRARSATDARSLRDARSLLGLQSPGDAETLARAFRTAIKAARPDQPGGDPERYRRIIAAYRLIQSEGPPLVALPAPVQHRSPLPAVIITPMQAMLGGRVRVTLPHGRTLRIGVPGGVRSGEHLRMQKGGSDGSDLFLPVLIRPDGGLYVVGDDLFMTWPVSRRLLDDGGRVEIETHAGPQTAWVTPGLASPVRLRLRELGLPARGERRQGHLFVTLEPRATTATLTEDRLARFTALWTPDRLAA